MFYSNYKATCDIEDAAQATKDMNYKYTQIEIDGRYDSDNNDGPRTNDGFGDDNQSIIGTCGSIVAEYDATNQAWMKL